MGGIQINNFVNPHLGDFDNVLKEYKQRIYFEGKKLLKYSNNKDYFDEVMQEGSIGLFEAYQNYDPNQYSVKFWSYAWYRVRGRMISFIDRHANLLKVSRNIKDIASKIKDMDMISWDAVNIAEVINRPILEVNSALVFLRNRYVDSLNRTMNYKGQSSLELGDILPDNNDYFATDEDELWKNEITSEVKDVSNTNQVKVLNERIAELENILRETQNKLKLCENEREDLWRIQDILRSRFVV